MNHFNGMDMDIGQLCIFIKYPGLTDRIMSSKFFVSLQLFLFELFFCLIFFKSFFVRIYRSKISCAKLQNLHYRFD